MIVTLGVIAVLCIVSLIVYATYESRRREALDRKLFPYEFQPLPHKPKYKTNAEAVQNDPARDAERIEAGCRVLRSKVASKRLGDLTVRETELLRVCGALGF
jgi:hypothetical protein